MASSVLTEIENRLPFLSSEERLQLIERLTRLQREKDELRSARQSEFERSVEAMARDPQIQAEIKAINEEFAGTEMDGLEKF